MENGVGLLDALIQELHGFFRWEDEQFNFAPPSLTSDLIHDWQCPSARAHRLHFHGISSSKQSGV